MTGLQLVGMAVATQEVRVCSTIEVIVTVLPPPFEVEVVPLEVVANVAVVLTVVVVVGVTVTVIVAGGRGYLSVQ